jgi:hypothetical protein
MSSGQRKRKQKHTGGPYASVIALQDRRARFTDVWPRLCEVKEEKDRVLFRENPHLTQVLFQGNELGALNDPIPLVRMGRSLGRKDRVMQPTDTRTPYARRCVRACVYYVCINMCNYKCACVCRSHVYTFMFTCVTVRVCVCVPRRQHHFKSVEHWGQRKLFFTELEFLLMYASHTHTHTHVCVDVGSDRKAKRRRMGEEDENQEERDREDDKHEEVEEGTITFLYAGAAPGTHIAYLSALFPHVHFILVDPAEFTVKATDRITIHQVCV